MKKLLLAVWLIAGIGMALWHFGPGQPARKRDAAACAAKEAEGFHRNGKPELAVIAYREALELLPKEDNLSQAKLRIGLAKSNLLASGLPQAREDMEALLNELPPNSDPAILAVARTTLAETQYYNTWLMRLEGSPREVWEPEVESARQLFRNQAENGSDREQAMRNLESTIRLARMDLTDLQGVPIPCQCRGCKSCKSKKGNKKKQPQAQQDVRSAGGELEFDQSGD